MASSGSNLPALAFLIEDGIALWESPHPAIDPQRMTVSLVAARVRPIMPFLWAVTAASNGETRVYRLTVSSLPQFVTRITKRKLMARLSTKLAGFGDPHVTIGDCRLSTIAVLEEPSQADSGRLTD